MLYPDTKKHFKVFRDPFIDDISSEADIYFSNEHVFAKQVMMDAARNGGFVAVIGEVGSGKSVVRRAVIEELKRDSKVLVIYPQMPDKKKLTAGSICDAIIYDVSTEKPLVRLEAKARQILRLLTDRSRAGKRHVLIIEEAHDLNINTLKYLKRFYEFEDGFRKLLGIILVGQLELKTGMDEQRAHEAREVIMRCQIATIKPLDKEIEAYLAMKFKRVGKSLDEVFAPGALEAMRRKMIDNDGGKKTSHIYPLMINNLTAKAMNLAAETGEPKVTAEVVEQV